MNSSFRKLLIALSIGLAATATMAANEESASAATESAEMSQAVQKSMDPNVWIKLMNSMMSGEMQGQPMISSCVECHSNEDIARYQKDFGGMMHAMTPMMQMGNPQLYGNMAGGMTNPMTGMINPMTGMMMAPMGMMNPMTGMMMAPMGMMNPMTGMMNPMGGMMPGMGMPPMGMMPGMGMPPMGMMPGMGMPPMGMPPMGMMPAMPGMPAPGGGVPPIGTAPGMAMPPLGMMPGMMNPGSGMAQQQAPMTPQQYQQFYQQWSDMMSKMRQGAAVPGAAESQ